MRNDVPYYSQKLIESAICELAASQFDYALNEKARLMTMVNGVIGQCGQFSLQGKRDSNEDSHLSIPFLNALVGRSVSCYCIVIM
jgi:hypothetical protein